MLHFKYVGCTVCLYISLAQLNATALQPLFKYAYLVFLLEFHIKNYSLHGDLPDLKTAE